MDQHTDLFYQDFQSKSPARIEPELHDLAVPTETVSTRAFHDARHQLEKWL